MTARGLAAGAPPHRLLWLCDGSPAATAWGSLVRWLAGLSVEEGDPAEVIVACALEGDVDAEVRAATTGAMAALAGDLESVGVAARAVVARTPVGELARALVDEHRVDLVVCGRTGHGGLQAALLGSTARDLVHGLDVPVLVVHPGGPPAPRRVLVGVALLAAEDPPAARAASLPALRAAAGLARRAHARLVVAEVVGAGPLPADRLARGATLEAEAAALLAAGPGGLHGLSWGARPVEADGVVAGLCEAARQADLLVLGTSRGAGRPRRTLGSAAAALVQRAPTHVLVVR